MPIPQKATKYKPSSCDPLTSSAHKGTGIILFSLGVVIQLVNKLDKLSAYGNDQMGSLTPQSKLEREPIDTRRTLHTALLTLECHPSTEN